MPDTKTCARCKREQPITEFYERSDRPGHRIPRCRSCEADRAASANEARAANVEARRAKANARRHSDRRARYAMTQEQVDAAEGIDHCEACGRTAEQVGHLGKSGSRLHFDHHHGTGVFRGVLCKPCNSTLGLVDDDPQRLLALAAYLQRSHP